MANSKANIDVQVRATKALLKFCREHHLSEKESAYVQHIAQCLHYLERRDVAQAIEHFQKVPLGGMGCFNDWFPPVIFPHEDGDYVWVVFDAQTAYWSHTMRHLI